MVLAFTYWQWSYFKCRQISGQRCELTFSMGELLNTLYKHFLVHGHGDHLLRDGSGH